MASKSAPWILGRAVRLVRAHCVVFLSKTLYSNSAYLHPQVHKRVPANLMLEDGGGGGGSPAMDLYPIQG